MTWLYELLSTSGVNDTWCSIGVVAVTVILIWTFMKVVCNLCKGR